MGSDAPVAPLDPWLAISAAVFGTESSDREPFQSEQCLDFETALASSTALGRTTLQAGDAADLVLLDCDPSPLKPCAPCPTMCSPLCLLGAGHISLTYLAYRWRNRKAARCYFAYRWRRLYVIKVLEGMIYTL